MKREMLKKKPEPVAIRAQELHESVMWRIKKMNPGMSFDECREKARHAIEVLREIRDLPRYSEVINMTHR